MKTKEDFLKLAVEWEKSVQPNDQTGALVELLQTVYEAGAGDYKNELAAIASNALKHDGSALMVKVPKV